MRRDTATLTFEVRPHGVSHVFNDKYWSSCSTARQLGANYNYLHVITAYRTDDTRCTALHCLLPGKSNLCTCTDQDGHSLKTQLVSKAHCSRGRYSRLDIRDTGPRHHARNEEYWADCPLQGLAGCSPSSQTNARHSTPPLNIHRSCEAFHASNAFHDDFAGLPRTRSSWKRH